MGKQQPAQCSRKTQDKFAVVSMAKKFLHCRMGVHAVGKTNVLYASQR